MRMGWFAHRSVRPTPGLTWIFVRSSTVCANHDQLGVVGLGVAARRSCGCFLIFAADDIWLTSDMTGL